MQENRMTQTTKLFNQGKYEQGLQKISRCILETPGSSILYSNRALFYYQLKNFNKAIQDLTSSIKINYLNYIAYFNLFSIQLRPGGLEKEAFEDLCCSLSVLYFLRGKSLKTQIDVQKSLKYCENNIEAHILKAMMHLENNKLKLAANQVQWALQYAPNNTILRKLRKYLHQKIGYETQDYQNETNQFVTNQKQSFRLECSLEVDEMTNLEKQIESKLIEFTEIYNDLNQIHGTSIQRIIIETDSVLNEQGNNIGQQIGIWDSGKKSQIFIQRIPTKSEPQNPSNLSNHSHEETHSNFLSEHDIVEEHDIQQKFQTKRFQDKDNKNAMKDQTQEQTKDYQLAEKQTDFFIANERQDIIEDDFLVDQQNVKLTYENMNKKFSKKRSGKSYQALQNQIKPQKNQSNTDNLNAQNNNEENLINQMQFQVPLPAPLNNSGSDFLEKTKNDNFEKENQQSSKNEFLTQLNEKNHVPSYGEILTKSNDHIEFHESQFVEFQNITSQQNETVQNTLINDLMSNASGKSRQSLNNLNDFQNNNLIEQKLKKIKERVIKNLDNSAKKLPQKQSFENDSKSSENLSEKISQKIDSIPLYPYGLPKKQIFFFFNSIQFSKKYKIAQLDEIYLVAVYHLSIPKYKMKTQPKKLQGAICNLNEKFPEVNLLEQQKSLKITVFNKAKGMKARDQLLGEGEKEVTETGSVRLGVYDKKLLIGYAKFTINLI